MTWRARLLAALLSAGASGPGAPLLAQQPESECTMERLVRESAELLRDGCTRLPDPPGYAEHY